MLPLHHRASYSPSSPKVVALREEVVALLAKGTIERAPPSPGFSSRLFVVWNTSGSWRPVINLSRLNGFVLQIHFKMETSQLVLQSIRRMVSIDLKDVYLQVAVHLDSHRFLRFVVDEQDYQFQALCFDLNTAPQVFTQVMAPVSLFLYQMGVRLLHYLDDWLILASSHPEAIQARDLVLYLRHWLGIVVNLDPCQTATYLGMMLVSPSLRAFPSSERVATLLVQIEEFLSCRRQNVVSWRSLLSRLLSLCRLVPGGRLRMRSLQLPLSQQWDFTDELVVLQRSPEVRSDLFWWSNASHLLEGVSLPSLQPDVLFWSDASDHGWEANIQDHFVSGHWSQEEVTLFISLRELRAIRLGLCHFTQFLKGHTVGVCADNTTTLCYLRRQGGGTFTPALKREAQLLPRRLESLQIRLVPQFIMGAKNVSADSLSRLDQVIGSEWTLAQDVVFDLVRRWPATIDLIATSLNYRLPMYFSPFDDPMAAGTDAFLHSWEHLQAYAFPPFSLLRQVLDKLRSSRGAVLTLVVLLRDLIRSFELECPRSHIASPGWDLVRVLSFLRGSSFEPLSSCSLRSFTMKVLFLLSLATVKRVSELQAFSRHVAFQGPDMSASYLPEYMAKTESVWNPLPRFFVVKSLVDFVGDMSEELLLCPVWALLISLERTSSLSPRPRDFLFPLVLRHGLHPRTHFRSSCGVSFLTLAPSWIPPPLRL